MDLQTIFTAAITSLLSSSLIAAGIIYIVKKSIDRAIDLRYEKLLEELKLQAQETARRKSALYDQQSKAIQVCISHIHRLRRQAREMEEMASSGIKGAKRKEFDALLLEFNQQYKAFMDFLSDNRVILPRIFTEARHDTGMLVANIQAYRDLAEKTIADRAISEQIIASLKNSLTQLDEQYFKLLERAQTTLGMDEEN